MPKKVTPKSKSPKKVKSVEEQIQQLGRGNEEKKVVPPQVMQVVEVADEMDASTVKQEEVTVENKEDQDNTPENLEVEVNKEDESEKSIEEDVSPSFSDEKQKEVVSEFFSPKIEGSVGYPNISVHKKSIAPIIFWALGVCVIVVAIGVGIITMSKGKFPISFIKPTPTPTIIPTPTVTPTPVVDRKEISIEVLNGSGVAGAASKMKAFLEEKGYIVAGMGNAKSYDYEQTEIQIKESFATYSAIIQADLTGSYVVGTSSSLLKSSLPYDAVVIIGKE